MLKIARDKAKKVFNDNMEAVNDDKQENNDNNNEINDNNDDNKSMFFRNLNIFS